MVENFPPDRDNPGCFMVWGVYRMEPWHLAGVFGTQAEAKARCDELGSEYDFAFGSHRPGSDDFVHGSSS